MQEPIDLSLTPPIDPEAAGRSWFQIGIFAGIVLGIVLAFIIAGRLAQRASEPPPTDPDAPV